MKTKPIKIGSIPENIRAFVRPPIEMKFKWDDIDVEDDVAVNIVKPMFVTDSTNAKTQVTAKSWASQARWSWDPVTGKRVDASDSFTEFERPNVPMTGIRIIGLDIRGQGGRAYQALIDEEYVFDLREDVLLDTMLNDGMGKNGTLLGSYIFAVVGSSMKLIRVGSLLHSKMIEATEYGAKKPISAKDIVVGGIYRNRQDTFLYLGQVNTLALHVNYPNGTPWSMRDRIKPHIYFGNPQKIFLTVTLDSRSDLNLKSILEHTDRWDLNWVYSKPTSYRAKVGQLDEELPVILDAIRAKMEYTYSSVDDLASASYALNASVTPGFIHPLLARHVN